MLGFMNTTTDFIPAGAPDPALARLAGLLGALAPGDGTYALPLPGVYAIRASRPNAELVHGLQGPSVCIIAQGAKTVMLGNETYDYDAARAVAELADVLVHVHLKDVRTVGGHETCRYGEGVVALEACVRELQRQGYTGGISIEHEPEHRGPNDDLRASLKLLQSWLA